MILPPLRYTVRVLQEVRAPPPRRKHLLPPPSSVFSSQPHHPHALLLALCSAASSGRSCTMDRKGACPSPVPPSSPNAHFIAGRVPPCAGAGILQEIMVENDWSWAPLNEDLKQRSRLQYGRGLRASRLQRRAACPIRTTFPHFFTPCTCMNPPTHTHPPVASRAGPGGILAVLRGRLRDLLRASPSSSGLLASAWRDKHSFCHFGCARRRCEARWTPTSDAAICTA